MKKSKLTLVLLCCIFSVSAAYSQTFSEVEKPNSKDNPWSIEMLIRTNNNGGINWTTPSLRGRYFFNDKWNLRLQVGLGDGSGNPTSEKYHYYEKADGTGEVGTATYKRTSFNLQLGTEYHFLGTKKLDPYVMLGLNFGYGQEMENLDHVTTYTIMPGEEVLGYNKFLSNKTTNQYNVLGVDLGLGIDFYFVENIFIGLECGFSNSYFNYKDGTRVATNDNNTPASHTIITPGHKESFLGAKAELRLGWRF